MVKFSIILTKVAQFQNELSTSLLNLKYLPAFSSLIENIGLSCAKLNKDHKELKY